MPNVAGPTLTKYLFDQNWRLPPTLTSEFEVQIDRNIDGTEQRRSLRGKPRRTMPVNGLTLSPTDAARVLVHMRTGTETRLYYPLHMDESLLLADAPSGSGVLQCDTDDRRFFAGHDILIVNWLPTKQGSLIERHTINQVLPGSLDLVGTVGSSFSAGVSIYPCMIVDALLQQVGQVENDSVYSFNLTLKEFIDSNTLPALADPNTIPAGINSYKGLPVLDIPHHWQTTSEGVIRRGRTTEIGLGTLTALYSEAADYTAQLAFRQLDRASAFDLLRFFESRAGSTFPFWYPMKGRTLDLISKTATSLRVVQTLTTEELEDAGTVLSIWMKDGTVLIRFIVGTLSTGSQIVISLNESVSQSEDEIERISFATLARFGQDSLNEQWRNLNTMETGLSIQGLPFSGDPSCVGEDCEDGGCDQPADCDDPEDPTDPEPPDDPWEPKDECLAGTATVPMYYDLTETWNSGREPIRAGDLNLPDELVVNVKDTFLVDSNHPNAPADLSQELKDVLFQPHLLTYAGTITRAGSRNPYHYKVVGIGPFNYSTGGATEAIEDSPYWEVQVPYKLNEGEPEEEDHTLTIRVYAEWVDQSTAGGDSGSGAWGAMFVMWAWSTEYDSYTDGTPYAPFDNVSFTKEDPFVGGLYESLSAATKHMHPSALFVAMCPTTWHNPIGYDFHSMLDRNQYLHECFASDPGAPWSNGGTTDALDNAVFGEIDGSTGKRALGALGGWTSSEFFNWTCIENTSGDGTTILKPTRPGWDEATATLTPGSADVSISVCTPLQTPIDPCAGHPDDPLEGRGGTHVCWRDNSLSGATKWICLGVDDVTDVRVTEKCVTVTGTYDATCELTDFDCFDTDIVTTFGNLRVEDYGYNFGGSQSARFIDFRQYEDDPNYTRVHWPQIQCDTPGTYWDDDIGTSSLDALNCADPVGNFNLTPTTGKTVNLLVGYNPPSALSVEDGEIRATATLTSTDQVGVGMRVDSLSGDIIEGYLGIVDVVNQRLVLYVVDGTDSISILAEQPVTIPTGTPLTLVFTSLGNKHSFHVEGLEGFSVSVTDCSYKSGGEPAMVALSESSFSFDNVGVTDNNWQKLNVNGDINGTASITSSVNSNLCKGYTQGVLQGTCDGCEPEDCPGDPCNGPCTSICKTVQGTYSVSSSDYPAGAVEPHNVDWHPPTDVGPCEDDDPAPPCDDCPAPYVAYSWDFGEIGCGDNTGNESEWIGGLSHWVWAEIFVP